MWYCDGWFYFSNILVDFISEEIIRLVRLSFCMGDVLCWISKLYSIESVHLSIVTCAIDLQLNHILAIYQLAGSLKTFYASMFCYLI